MATKNKYITLDEQTVVRKMVRIYDKVNDLGKYATSCNTARLKLKWKQNGYKERLNCNISVTISGEFVNLSAR